MNKLSSLAKPQLWLGIVISVIFVFLAFRNVQWVELVTALKGMQWSILFLAMVLCFFNLLIRGIRWQILLAPLGLFAVRDAFVYLNIGYMANNLLPFRLGEIIRAVLLGQKKAINTSAVLATIVLERLLDMLSLSALTLILMLAMPIAPLMKQTALVFGGMSFLGVAGLWWVAGHLSAAGMEKLQTSPESNYAAHLGRAKLTRALQIAISAGRLFTKGLAAVRSPRQAAAAVTYSILAWGLAMGFTWLVLEACSLHLPWTATLMVVVMVNLGVAIPSAPGFVGVMHFLAVLALSPWAADEAAALGFSVIYHALPFLITVALGGAFLWKEGTQPLQLLGAGSEAVGTIQASVIN